jgi:hypothetical protein
VNLILSSKISSPGKDLEIGAKKSGPERIFKNVILNQGCEACDLCSLCLWLWTKITVLPKVETYLEVLSLNFIASGVQESLGLDQSSKSWGKKGGAGPPKS